MAVIGTIDSTFLAPGISENGRLYTPEIIERAVARMQARLADPAGFPITMLSHHAAGDDSKELAARITSVDLDPATHEATLFGYLIDTRAGSDIAKTLEPGPDGRRVLDSVSIRGWWLGPVRRVDVDGRMCETGDDIEIDGVDFTKSPGVRKARIRNAVSLAAETTEADARTPITESVEVTVMSDRVAGKGAAPSPRDMPGAKPPKGAAAEPSEPEATETGQAGTDTPAGEPAAEKPAQAAETAEAARARYDAMLEAIREAHIAISGWQGPVDIDIDAWGLSNDDVVAAATKLGQAFDAALVVLDPDRDDDLDLPDGDAAATCPSCSGVLPDGAAFCPACGAPAPADEDDDMAGESAADTTRKDTTVAEKKDGAPADETGKGTPTDETTTPEGKGPATTEDTTDPGATTPAATDAAPDAGATAPALTSADHDAIATALAAKLTAAAAQTESATGKPATEAAPAGITAEQMAEALAENTAAVTKAITDQVRAEFIEKYGTPGRAGLIEAAKKSDGPDPAAMAKMTPAELASHAAGIWNTVPQFADQG